MCCGSGDVVVCGWNCEIISLRHYANVGGCGGCVMHVELKSVGNRTKSWGINWENFLCDMTCY